MDFIFSRPFFLLILLTLSILTFSQNDSIPLNEYGLRVIDSYALYEESIEHDSTQIMVDLEEFIPGIILDIRYATVNNFTGEKVYKSPKAFLRLNAARALKEVQDELNESGLGLIVFDAYRPYAATLRFYEIVKDTLYVATPWGGSRHNRGCAVDVSLCSLGTGSELVMPTPFDDFSEKAAPDYMDHPDEAINNRMLLIETMKKYGFSVYKTEWWHFDFEDWEKYRILDIEHERF